MDKKVRIQTRSKKQVFKVAESKSSGNLIISEVDFGLFSSNLKKIGESRSMEDALDIIKSFVSGEIRNTKIEDWR